jgi:chromosome segregation ATPase
MPDFNEQLRMISGLREKCRKCDEILYRARVGLHRTTQRLRRAKQRQTIVESDRDRQVANLRVRMARIDASLAALREEAYQVGQWFAQLAEQQRLIEHLQQNLTASRNRDAALRRQIAELQQQDPPPANEIEVIEAEIHRLERVQADIGSSIARASEVLHELEGQQKTQRRKREELQREIEALREELSSAQGRLTELLQPAFDDTEAVHARRNEIEYVIERIKVDYGDCDGQLSAAIGDLYRENPHPRYALRRLDDRIPFLLFPVRLETIFVPTRFSSFYRLTKHSTLV